jgi:antitoxin PrlF
MITSRLTSKAQTTIPRSIRAALRLREGDELVYQIDGDRVILSKAPQDKVEDDPFRAFGEWDSAADNRAYAKL